MRKGSPAPSSSSRMIEQNQSPGQHHSGKRKIEIYKYCTFQVSPKFLLFILSIYSYF